MIGFAELYQYDTHRFNQLRRLKYSVAHQAMEKMQGVIKDGDLTVLRQVFLKDNFFRLALFLKYCIKNIVNDL